MVNKLEELSSVYGTSSRYFKVRDALYPVQTIDKVYSFYSNPHVRDRLFHARGKQLRNPASFNEALSELSNYVGTAFDYREDFSNLTDFASMWNILQSYCRNDNSTSASKQIKNKLEKVFKKFIPRLISGEVYPLVFGSLRYGDAKANSDVDMFLLVNDKKLPQQSVYIGLEKAISGHLSNLNSWKDDLGFKESVLKIPELVSVLIDVIDGEVTSIQDYTFNGYLFYPYNWVLEGYCPVSGLGKIETDVKELKSMIEEAVKVDPLFDLMMSLRLHRSISRRKDNLHRK